MGYIYCITNLINSKRYIGKTVNNIKERFKEHCRDSRKERCNKRPLYDAMNKYGVENFIVEELEYVEDDNKLSEREIYWINELQTYGRNGYNATKGGDGTILYDHNEIVELYNLGYSTGQIASKLNCDTSTIRKVLKSKGIKSRGLSHIIDQFDLAGNYIQTFDSAVEAGQWIVERGLSKSKHPNHDITRCCKGVRNKKRAFGYIWKYKTIQE